MNNLTPPAMPVRVFTLQLGWEKEREDSRDIRDTMATITEVRSIIITAPFSIYGQVPDERMWSVGPDTSFAERDPSLTGTRMKIARDAVARGPLR
jgi:hypothetical protein